MYPWLFRRRHCCRDRFVPAMHTMGIHNRAQVPPQIYELCLDKPSEENTKLFQVRYSRPIWLDSASQQLLHNQRDHEEKTSLERSTVPRVQLKGKVCDTWSRGLHAPMLPWYLVQTADCIHLHSVMEELMRACVGLSHAWTPAGGSSTPCLDSTLQEFQAVTEAPT